MTRLTPNNGLRIKNPTVRNIITCAIRVRKLTVIFERPVRFEPRLLKVEN